MQTSASTAPPSAVFADRLDLGVASGRARSSGTPGSAATARPAPPSPRATAPTAPSRPCRSRSRSVFGDETLTVTKSTAAPHCASTAAKSAGAVGASLLAPRFSPTGTPRGRAASRARDCLHAVVVEAEPVDHRIVLRQPEQPRPRVARLRPRRRRTDLDKAEPGAHQLAQPPPRSCRTPPPARRDWAAPVPASVVASRGEVTGPGSGASPSRSARSAKAVRGFGVEPGQERHPQPLGQAHADAVRKDVARRRPAAAAGARPRPTAPAAGRDAGTARRRATAPTSAPRPAPSASQATSTRSLDSGEPLRGGLAHLVGGGEMDEAVGHVDRRAVGQPVLAQRRPFAAPGISCRPASPHTCRLGRPRSMPRPGVAIFADPGPGRFDSVTEPGKHARIICQGVFRHDTNCKAVPRHPSRRHRADGRSGGAGRRRGHQADDPWRRRRLQFRRKAAAAAALPG